ncbi:hypothetical protein Ciccas_006649 [Cichlidogyrus casuarinus]|uniref:Uncharacterized protein n=1 Tax=Cichlidogyrus casuarinus TaxID=1844966 RepID=A0ABD2Q561_9PLAT
MPASQDIAYINRLSDDNLRDELISYGQHPPPILDPAVRNILRLRLLKIKCPDVQLPDDHAWNTDEDGQINGSCSHMQASISGDCASDEINDSSGLTIFMISAIILLIAIIFIFLPKALS